MRTTHAIGADADAVTVTSRVAGAATADGGYPAVPAEIVTCGRARGPRTVAGVLAELRRRSIAVADGLAVEIAGDVAAAANEAMLADWLAEHLARGEAPK